jgi:CRISPR system Cascade subunit CasE
MDRGATGRCREGTVKLSRLHLDLADRTVRSALGDPHRMHQLVMAAFPTVGGSARASLGILHRVETNDRGGCMVYVQSRESPNWAQLADTVFDRQQTDPAQVRDLTPDLAAIRSGETMMFRLLANVTRRIDTKTREDGVRRHGKRVPLRDHDARVAWLQRKAIAAGFELVEGWSGHPDVRVTEHAPVHGHRADGGEHRRVTFEGVTFEGLLRINDPEAFRSAVQSGIGPARAYGFGLLSFRHLG